MSLSILTKYKSTKKVLKFKKRHISASFTLSCISY
nr:MAG TPA: hypothetical protein [Caudoviricetes sp.]